VGAKYWDVGLQFIEPWSLTASPANQYVTAATILSKDICEPCVEARAKWYLEKGVESDMDTALDRARRFYLSLSKSEIEEEQPITSVDLEGDVNADAQDEAELEKTVAAENLGALRAVHRPRHAQRRIHLGGPGIKLAPDRCVVYVSRNPRASVGQPPTVKASPARQTNWIKAFIIRRAL